MLKLQIFGHLMWRADSLEKILMLGNTEDRSVSKLRETVRAQGNLACCSSLGSQSQTPLGAWTKTNKYLPKICTSPKSQRTQYFKITIILSAVKQTLKVLTTNRLTIPLLFGFFKNHSNNLFLLRPIQLIHWQVLILEGFKSIQFYTTFGWVFQNEDRVGGKNTTCYYTICYWNCTKELKLLNNSLFSNSQTHLPHLSLPVTISSIQPCLSPVILLTGRKNLSLSLHSFSTLNKMEVFLYNIIFFKALKSISPSVSWKYSNN